MIVIQLLGDLAVRACLVRIEPPRNLLGQSSSRRDCSSLFRPLLLDPPVDLEARLRTQGLKSQQATSLKVFELVDDVCMAEPEVSFKLRNSAATGGHQFDYPCSVVRSA